MVKNGRPMADVELGVSWELGVGVGEIEVYERRARGALRKGGG